MNKLTKIVIKTFFISGLIYAGLMAGYDYSQENEFKVLRFILHFIFFGGFMSLIARFNNKKQKE
jgi:hypothetical protein